MSSTSSLRVLLFVGLFLAAGCLEQEKAPTPTTTTTPTPPGGATPVTIREIETGSNSGVSDVRAVFETSDAWDAFWADHTADQLNAPGAPSVDFSKERAVAVVLADKPNGCWAVRVTNATQEGTAVTVDVTTYTPPADMACTSVITQPYAFVAIPVGAPVAFREMTSAGPPPSDE